MKVLKNYQYSLISLRLLRTLFATAFFVVALGAMPLNAHGDGLKKVGRGGGKTLLNYCGWEAVESLFDSIRNECGGLVGESYKECVCSAVNDEREGRCGGSSSSFSHCARSSSLCSFLGEFLDNRC